MMPASLHHADPLLSVSFFGPWVPQASTQAFNPSSSAPAGVTSSTGVLAAPPSKRTRHHYLSLAHWYEAAKFMPGHPELRDAVGHCPTVKEARKFAKARQAQWRSDWNLVRHRVLIAGMGFLSLDRPDLQLPAWNTSRLSEEMSEMGLPVKFVSQCLEKFQAWGAGPKIATVGADKAPEQVVGRKMSKLVEAHPSWTLLSFCNGRAAWRVHDWALSMYVPVAYVGTPTSRTSTGLRDELITGCDRLVVFETKGGRSHDAVIRRAKMLDVPMSLELY